MSITPQNSDVHLADADVVACDGNNASGLGHPRVFLAFGDEREIVCPYCSRVFKRTGSAKPGNGH